MISETKNFIEGEWLLTDELGQFPERIVRSFIQNSDDDPPSTSHIVRHFHESVNDNQIRRVKQFFKGCYIGIHDTTWGDNKQFQILMDLHFGKPGQSRINKVFFGLEKDHFFNCHRITGVRVLDYPRWRIKKTVFAVNRDIFNWKTSQSIFYHK
jgi:hypothetical protein